MLVDIGHQFRHFDFQNCIMFQELDKDLCFQVSLRQSHRQSGGRDVQAVFLVYLSFLLVWKWHVWIFSDGDGIARLCFMTPKIQLPTVVYDTWGWYRNRSISFFDRTFLHSFSGMFGTISSLSDWAHAIITYRVLWKDSRALCGNVVRPT